jgi:hypothetical protein
MTPARRRVALPDDGLMPRVGKIRLGTTTEYERDGETRYRPVKADHFVVVADESGITSPEAAAAFASVYGAEPRELHAALPGREPDDVMEGAWRLYGAKKVKRKCDGETCDERLDAGGWETKPCVCAAQGISVDDKKRHCTLTYTLQLLLPDVPGVGVWQLDSGSEITARRMATWLRMMHTLRGDLRMLEFDLRLVATSVNPEGKPTTVYVLDPQARNATPRQMLSGAGDAPQLAELPPPAADEAPEETLDRGGFTPDADQDSPAAASYIPSSAAGEHDDHLDEIRRTNVEAQIRFLAPPVGQRLKALCEHYGVKPTRDGLIAQWGDRATDLPRLVDELEDELNTEAQLALGGGEDDQQVYDGEPVAE